MQVEHKTEKGTVLFVLQPKEASNLTYPKVGMIDLYFDKKTKSGIEEEEDYISIGLHYVGFELICLTSEITEEQAKMMIDSVDGISDTYFKDYLILKHSAKFQFACLSALYSFKSLMQHLHVYEVNTYAHFTNPEDFDDEAIEHAQELSKFVGKWIVLFKPE